MHPQKIIILLFIVCCCYCYCSVENAACSELGYIQEKLACSTCRDMTTFVTDAVVVGECNKCCNAALDQEKAYKSAILQVCRMRLHGHPEVQHFINKRSNSFKTLRIEYIHNMNPQLIMTSKQQQDAAKDETLSIVQWSSDDIFSYLSKSIQ
jgi:thioredoxin reductase